MKKSIKIAVLAVVLFLFTIFFSLISIVSAHPGRTDSRGGHTCYTNCKKWGLKYGQYHKHRKNSNKKKNKRKSRRRSRKISKKRFKCNCRKTCTKIKTCKEAKFQLRRCGCTARDADHDGIPCENRCR